MSNAATIRDAMVSEVRTLTPTVAADVKFEHHQEDFTSFVDFCEKNPPSAFRKFAIRNTEGHEILASWGDFEHVKTVFECIVAYPRDLSYGAQAQLDLDDVIEMDAMTIRKAIGTRGYSTLDISTGGDAVVTDRGHDIETGRACVFLVVTLDAEFRREFATS